MSAERDNVKYTGKVDIQSTDSETDFINFFKDAGYGFFILKFSDPIKLQNGVLDEADFRRSYYESRISYSNHALEVINGWSSVNRESITPSDLFLDEPDDGIRIWRELLRNGECRYEKIVMNRLQQPVYISGTYKTIKNSFGLINGIYGIENDVTGFRQKENDLVRKSDEMERFFTVALDLMCIADIGGHLLKINRAWERTLGYTIEELENSVFIDFIHPDDVSLTENSFAAMADQIPVMSFTARFRKADGAYRFIEWRGYPSGRLIYMAARDITERIDYEAELNKLAERLTLAAGSAGMGIWDWDIARGELVWDRRMYELYGITKDNTPDIYRGWMSIVHPDDRDRIESAFRAGVKSLAMFNSDFRVVWSDGSIHYLEAHALVIRNGNGRAERITGVTWDITSNKRMEEKLLALSVTDPLTFVFNRRYLLKALDTELSRANRYGTKFSLIMFDLDHFKDVNDTYGHDAGDEILKVIASVIKRRIRKNDILSRWGGEEFMILLPGTGIGSAITLAEKLLMELRDTGYTLQPGRITASFGVAEYNADETADSLLKRTDELVYLAKDCGRNCIRY